MSSDPSGFPPQPPRSILLLKAHSAGIGDLLRSSAAWRVLHNRFPGVQLHLWFLTRDPGSPSEELIARHHLLASFRASNKRTEGYAGWKKLLAQARQIARDTRPDLVVDCEPNGLRTTILARLIGLWAKARTVGISQVPGRGWLYHRAAPSYKAYARRHDLPLPFDYVDRDFVALAALGLERAGTAIELRETEEGRAFREKAQTQLGGLKGPPWLGLNIGCGARDNYDRRPDADLLAGLIGELQRRHGFALVLTGASYEREINQHFLSRLQPGGPVIDLAGRTNLLELTGIIAGCRLFISSDSGPYHMAVGLRVPTLAIFLFNTRQHFHQHPWVECMLAKDARQLSDLLAAAERLLRVGPPPAP